MINNKMTRSLILASALGAVGVGLACCSGGTDGETAGDINLSNDFVGGPGATGGLTLTVLDDDFGVGETSGFGVKVVDAQGNPVKGISVSCDTEAGVGILEPQSGSEITDSSGNVSGVIGCSAPGSYQFVCRLAIGANKRQQADIKCRGPIPDGFTGFTAAAGGGLGGGSNTSGSGGVGGTNTDGVRISHLVYLDDGSLADASNTTAFSIDIEQDICNPTAVGAGTPTPVPEVEPFFDTVAAVDIVNNTNQTVFCSSADYVVANAGTTANSGTNFVSNSISVFGDAAAVEGGGGKGSFFFLVFDASAGGKKFVGASTIMDSSADSGFKSVTLNVHCTGQDGADIDLTATQTLSFDDFGRCNS